jgi:DNA polymerase-3 subunit delta'
MFFFRDIHGHEALQQRLIQSVKDGIVPHARLLAGREGALPLALAYARYLHCTDRGETDACGQCPSCQQFNKLAHPDMHFVFPILNKKGSKDAYCDDYLPEWRSFLTESPDGGFSAWLATLGAEKDAMIYARESDEILRKLSLKAYESEYKIMLIWLPEKMHEAAANKLLKLLEEPPAKTVFLLVSAEPERVLTTIRSRAQTLIVPPLPGSLAAIGPENEAFLDLFTTVMRNSWTRNIVNMKAKSETFASWSRDRQKGFLSYAQRLIRENFLYDLPAEIHTMNTPEADFAVKFHPYVKAANVVDFMNELALAEQHLDANVNPRMIFFDLSMKIAVLLKK